MSFIPHELRPQRHVDFPTIIYNTDHTGFTATGKRIEKPTSQSEPVAANIIEEADGISTEKQ